MYQSATNAFLKTLEEPPEYVIFILATTDLRRIPSTILSRCQRYDFKRISNDKIINHMMAISKTIGIQVEEKALKRIATLSEGSMRDALSLLDQVQAMSNSNDITLADTLKALSRMDMAIYAKCVH